MDKQNGKEISFVIEEAIALQAERVYQSLGLDTETALKMFMRRTVLEGGLPLASSTEQSRAAAAAPVDASGFGEGQRAPQGKITAEMLEGIWTEFIAFQHGAVKSDIVEGIVEKTGMNEGTARIYVTFLFNLLGGARNTRTIKINDLRYFLGMIESDLGEGPYSSAIKSLEASVDGWDNPRHGKYAEQVREYIELHPAGMQ